jgi:putative NIF3 family GTP cyclohydrolase 1 type 2
MLLHGLRHELDELFSIAEWDRDPAMSRWVPRVYQAIDYDHTRIFEPDFCARYNGLMVRAAETVEQVYCAAFPSPEVLGNTLDRKNGPALLFLHHPVDMEVGGAGFLPIPPAVLERMRTEGISVYSCHAPLDCHDEIGTSVSIAQAFHARVERSFAPYGNGFSGRMAAVGPVSLAELIARGQEAFGVERVEVGGAEPARITRVAIVAGGGDDVELMEEAEALGAQAYITGEWYTRTVPSEESERRWAETNRAVCQSYAASSRMALLGFSHAASEFLVMRDQMAGWFQRRGLPVECLEQADWWR